MPATRYLLIFLVVFLAACVSLIANNIAIQFSENDSWPNFDALKDGERIVTLGFDPAAEARIKFEYLRRGPRYKIGSFSDHTASLFSRDAFPASLNTSFFNFHTATSSLPEIYDILQFAHDHDKLPSELVIVLLDHPYISQGTANARRRSSILHEAILPLSAFEDARPLDWIALVFDISHRVIQISLDWRTLWANYFLPQQASTVLSKLSCNENDLERASAEKAGLPSRIVPTTVNYYLRLRSLPKRQQVHSLLCRNAQIHAADTDLLPGGFWRDGSEAGRPTIRPLPRHIALEKDQYGIEGKDINTIVRYIERIDAFVNRSGSRAVFVIPPFHGEDRASPLNRSFDNITRDIDAGIKVLDHRGRFRSEEYFANDSEHPRSPYYIELVEELVARGWLKQS